MKIKENCYSFLLVCFLFLFFTACHDQASPTTSNPGYNGGQIYSAEVFPGEGDLFAYAQFRIWIPDGSDSIKGIIHHQHGCGRNGLSIPYDIHWQALAKKWNFALMGSHFIAHENCNSWSDPENGSERAFLKGLEILAQNASKVELTTVPWCLWGHSGGGKWVLKMLERHRGKVIAVFGRSARYLMDDPPMDVPVVLCYGITDFRPDAYYNTFLHAREKGASWALAMDPETGHNTGYSRFLSIPFFDECIQRYMETEFKRENRNNISYNVILGDNMTGELFLEESVDPTAPETVFSWLLSSSFSEKWKEFIQTGWVTDRSAPENPGTITGISVEENRAEIHFTILADIQSGVKDIFLICDDTDTLRYIGPNDEYNRKHFQSPNYGDEPVPEALYENVENWIPPRLSFYDYRIHERGDSIKYSLLYTNWSDLTAAAHDTVWINPQ